jgi:ribokinase
MARVLVVGALHHDVIVTAPRLPGLDETLVGDGVTYALGGKGGNQALAAARHGADVFFAGRVGTDEAGRSMLAQLVAGGVDASQVTVDAERSSGMSVAILTANGEYGAVIVSAANSAIIGETVTLPDGCGIVVLQNEVPEAVNLAVARSAKDANARVILNAAPARTCTPELLALTDIVAVNRVEAEMMAHSLDAYCGTLIETRGAEGCLVRVGNVPTRHLPAFPVSVLSAHGAGDCFVGALAARLCNGDPLETAALYASAAAALHVSTPVGQRASVALEQVLHLMETRHADGH